MTSDDAVIKYRPDELLVRETLVARCVPRSQATHELLLLRKCGYTTMEACRLIADDLALALRDVSWGGLKDEDGITEQLIGVAVGTFDHHRERSQLAPHDPSR